jgi:hypothetical protein
MARIDQLEHANGPQLTEVVRLAHLCTSQHMPGHFPHMPEQAQTCLYKPAHAYTTKELPSQRRKPLCGRYLHHRIRIVSGMVQTQVTTPSPNSVGNSLRGVPGPLERHGVRSLQDNRRIVTQNVGELNHA